MENPREQEPPQDTSFSSSSDVVPISLDVVGVEGDKLSMCLFVRKLENGGWLNKTVSFFFDVSEDNVVVDAQGLVELVRPDFVLDENQLIRLLSQRITENMHLTHSGKRLMFSPSPKLDVTHNKGIINASAARALYSASDQEEEAMAVVPGRQMKSSGSIDDKQMEMLNRFAKEKEVNKAMPQSGNAVGTESNPLSQSAPATTSAGAAMIGSNIPQNTDDAAGDEN